MLKKKETLKRNLLSFVEKHRFPTLQTILKYIKQDLSNIYCYKDIRV